MLPLIERLKTGLRAPQDQGMHVMGPFIGIDHFQVDQVACHPELVRDAVTAQHVPGHARDGAAGRGNQQINR